MMPTQKTKSRKTIKRQPVVQTTATKPAFCPCEALVREIWTISLTRALRIWELHISGQQCSTSGQCQFCYWTLVPQLGFQLHSWKATIRHRYFVGQVQEAVGDFGIAAQISARTKATSAQTCRQVVRRGQWMT